MFEISDEAKDLIHACLESALEGRPELRRGATAVGLRLNFSQGAAHLSLALARPCDRVLSFMGRPLLIIDAADLERLDGACLTVVQGPNGRALSMVPLVAAQTVV